MGLELAIVSHTASLYLFWSIRISHLDRSNHFFRTFPFCVCFLQMIILRHLLPFRRLSYFSSPVSSPWFLFPRCLDHPGPWCRFRSLSQFPGHNVPRRPALRLLVDPGSAAVHLLVTCLLHSRYVLASSFARLSSFTARS